MITHERFSLTDTEYLKTQQKTYPMITLMKQLDSKVPDFFLTTYNCYIILQYCDPCCYEILNLQITITLIRGILRETLHLTFFQTSTLVLHIQLC